MIDNEYLRLREYTIAPDETKVFNSFSGFMLFYVRAGNGTFFLNEQSSEFVPGTTAVMSCLDFLKLKAVNTPVSLTVLEFTEDAFSGRILEFFSIRQLPIITNSKRACEKLDHLIELIHLCVRNKLEDNDIFLRNLSKEILIYTIKNNDSQIPNTVFDIKTELAILYIYMHFKESLSIEEVSAHVHYSANYFYHSFQKNTGISFQKFLHNLRMVYAKNLMKFTDLSISDICYECGYSSVQYFSTAFRKEFGKSPKNYISEIIHTGGKL